MSAALTEEVTAVLTDAGLCQAARTSTGHPATPGFTVDLMTQVGPVRAAVDWYATPAWAVTFGRGRCWHALARAGYQVTLVVGRGHRDYLAVLQPPVKTARQ